MGKWHGPEEKLKIIQAIQTSGKSVNEACQEAGISSVNIYEHRKFILGNRLIVPCQRLWVKP